MTDPIRDPDVEAFLAVSAARLAPRTVEAYRRDLTAAATVLAKPVGTATTEDIERYLAQLRAEGLASTTIARRAAAIRSFFRHQMLLGARTDNPPRPRARRADVRSRPARQRGRGARAQRRRPGRPLRPCGRQRRQGARRPDRPAGVRGTSPLPRPRPASSRPPSPSRALPERAGRPAHPRGRVPDPPQARRKGRARARARSPPPLAPLVRDASPRGRSRPTERPGDARPRRPGNHRALHTRHRPTPARRLFPGTSPRETPLLMFESFRPMQELGRDGDCRPGTDDVLRGHDGHRLPDDPERLAEKHARVATAQEDVPVVRPSVRGLQLHVALAGLRTLT